MEILEFQPLTLQNWKDLEELFLGDSTCRSCWCMWWRQTPSEWEKTRGAERKMALKNVVQNGRVPGILAYSNHRPIGWCSFGPRTEFIRLEKSRTLKRIDNQPVWSVVCFFVAKPFRGKGVSSKLLDAAVKYAQKCGADIVEGYPCRSNDKQKDISIYTGLRSMFTKTGFTDLGKTAGKRTIMRLKFKKPKSTKLTDK